MKASPAFFSKKNQRGFTLIELLVVITIIAILAVVVFVALDPARRFADARNSRRTVDVNTILTAFHAYTVDTGGTLPIAEGTSGEIGDCGTCVDLDSATDGTVSMTDYLESMPLDPQGGTTDNTGYYLTVRNNGIVTVAAINAEESASISASR